MRPLELTEHLHYNEEAKHRKNIISLQSNANVLLGEISSNQSNVHVNTDGLESLIGTDSAGSLAALTRIQKDVIDSKLTSISNFLDKDHAQFHLNHSPKGQDVKAVGEGLNQVLIYGRKDDGTLQPLECLGDRLLVDVVELAAAGKITTSTALAGVQVCGFDDTTNKFKSIKCNSDGELENNNSTKNQDITHSSVAVVIAGNGVDGEITLNDTDNYVRYMVEGISFSASLLYVEGSQDNSNFVRLGQLVLFDVNGTFHGTLLVDNPPKYVRIKNYDLSSATVKIQAIYGRK